jgi:hypothetical protein
MPIAFTTDMRRRPSSHYKLDLTEPSILDSRQPNQRSQCRELNHATSWIQIGVT